MFLTTLYFIGLLLSRNICFVQSTYKKSSWNTFLKVRTCCGWCSLKVVFSLFNVLNDHLAILVNHLVNRSKLTIWYSFTIADSIEWCRAPLHHSIYPCISSHVHSEVGRSISRYILVIIKVSLLKSKYVHGLRACNTNVIIILSYYQLLILV